MSYKTVLAYIDEAKRCETLLGVARQLAEAQKAVLIGLHVIPNVQIYAAGEPQIMADLFEAERQRFREVASEARAFFANTMKDASCDFEWREAEEGSETVGERVLEHGLVADLVITGQIDPEIDSPRRVGTPERIIMHGGRPQLRVPYIKREGDITRQVMIAWRASGEAARAVVDAMPLLQAAKKITILEVDSPASSDVERVAGGEALAANLERHGVVTPEVEHTPSAGIGVGATILARISDEDASLLVMGGYGHSRLGEYLFGGATREILQQMTVPVLISH